MDNRPEPLVFRRHARLRPGRNGINWMPWLWMGLVVAGFAIALALFGSAIDQTSFSEGTSLVSTQPAPPQPEQINVTDAQPNLESISHRTTSQRIYKCRGASGEMSFQSEPCAAGDITLRVAEVSPGVQAGASNPVYVSSVASEPEPVRSVPQAAQVRPYEGRDDLKQARCEAAKAQREETRRRVGLARTYDLIEQLDEMVRQACKAG